MSVISMAAAFIGLAHGQSQYPPATEPGNPYPAPAPAASPVYSGGNPYPAPGPATAPVYSGGNPYPAPAPVATPVTNPSGGSVTVYNYVGVNSYWYAVAAVVNTYGVGVASLKMQDSKMQQSGQWEVGYQQYDYYCDCDAFQFYYNTPYTPPFSFQATLTNGQTAQGYNVITTLYDGDSGQLSMSGAFTAEDESLKAEGHTAVSTEGLIAIVTITILLLCLMTTLCFVCHRRKNKKLSAGVEDDAVIGGNLAIVEDDVMEQDGGYDMTPIGDGNRVITGNTGDDEQAIMVDAQVTETVH